MDTEIQAQLLEAKKAFVSVCMESNEEMKSLLLRLSALKGELLSADDETKLGMETKNKIQRIGPLDATTKAKITTLSIEVEDVQKIHLQTINELNNLF